MLEVPSLGKEAESCFYETFISRSLHCFSSLPAVVTDLKHCPMVRKALNKKMVVCSDSIWGIYWVCWADFRCRVRAGVTGLSSWSPGGFLLHAAIRSCDGFLRSDNKVPLLGGSLGVISFHYCLCLTHSFFPSWWSVLELGTGQISH